MAVTQEGVARVNAMRLASSIRAGASCNGTHSTSCSAGPGSVSSISARKKWHSLVTPLAVGCSAIDQRRAGQQPEPGLLGHLPGQRLLRRLPRLDPTPREVPLLVRLVPHE